jgi:peptidoglycan/xylan/chitin deacetylase (PgdA/CDA1 family)
MRRPLAAASLAAAAWSAPALASVSAPIASILGIPRRVPEADGVVLTFDDGPHPEGTPAVLEILREGRATAVFFLAGEQAERHQALAAEIAAAGHTIALHCHRHRNTLRLTPRAVRDDLDRGTAAIVDATGVAPGLHRPPYGIYSPVALAEVRRRGLRPLLWSRWGHDWRGGRAPERIAAEVTGGLSGGDVLLLHDADHYSDPGSWRNTVAALPRVLAAVEEAGLSLTAP